MNEPEINPHGSSSAGETNGEDTRRLINILFGAMIVSSFTLTAFLGLESKRVTKDAATTKAQINELVQAIQQQDAYIQAEYSKLSEFARKHPDFQNQVLWKYKLNPAPAAKPK